MQLVDFALWTSPSCGPVNTAATRAGIIINHLEPLVLYAAILALSPNELPSHIHGLALAYTVMTVEYTFRALKTVQCTEVTPESKPHLHWRWNDMSGKAQHYMLFLGLLVGLSIYGLKDHGYLHAAILLVSFGASYSVYQGRKSTGAMWCFLASFVPWLLVFSL